MKQDALKGAEKYTKAHKRKKRWYRVVTGMACVVVFCTVYALILPAIALEKGACEIPEHTHSEACYTHVYSTSPFFVMLPQRDLSGTTWNYHVVANAKPGQEPVKADFQVIKIWRDDCHKDQRPKSITISLICDGEVYDTITLPNNGAWNYTWEDLETNHQWTVTEEKEDGYQDPDILQEGNTFIVTNTCSKPTTPTQPGKPTLPQTGQLWWPVPVLICAGLLFIVIGLLRRRGIADEE